MGLGKIGLPLAVQFAAHDGVLNAEQIIAHVRIAAAREVGLGLDAFDGTVTAPADDARRAVAVDQARSTRQAGLRSRVERYHDALSRGDTDRATSALLGPLDESGR